MKLNFLLFSGLTMVLIVLACETKNSKITCDASTPTYNSLVKAIVDANCVSCHSGFSTYSGLSSVTTNGKLEEEVIREREMPKGGSLTEDQLRKLQCWVDNGFPEN